MRAVLAMCVMYVMRAVRIVLVVYVTSIVYVTYIVYVTFCHVTLLSSEVQVLAVQSYGFDDYNGCLPLNDEEKHACGRPLAGCRAGFRESGLAEGELAGCRESVVGYRGPGRA